MGLVPVARIAAEFPQIEIFAVAQLSEALQLRQAGLTQELLVLGCMPTRHLAAAVEAGVTITVGRPDMLPAIHAAAIGCGRPARIQLKLDTGLHRIGLTPGPQLDQWIREYLPFRDRCLLTGVYTQFSDAESKNAALCALQYERFTEGVAQLDACGVAPALQHVCNSAASEWLRPLPGNAVRVGRRLIMDAQTDPLGAIQEVASWRTTITCLHHLKAGDSVGYGGKVRLGRDADVATLAVGYGDGLNPLLASRGAPVLVGGRRARLLATCMDQCFVDVSGIPCRVDNEVTFFGYDRDGNFLSSQEVALLVDDEGCGLTEALTDRVARVYLP